MAEVGLWTYCVDEVAFQPLPVLLPFLDGGIGTGPLAAKDGQKAQFEEGADRRRAEQDCIYELELSISGLSGPLVKDMA